MLNQEFTLLIQIFRYLVGRSLLGQDTDTRIGWTADSLFGLWRGNIKRAEGGLGVLDFVE